jgi:predicted secreted protein
MLPYFRLKDLKTFSEVVSGNVLYLAVILAAVIIGGIYYGLDVRDLLWRSFVRQCHENIRAKMIKPNYGDPVITGLIDRLTDQMAMRIFYHIVDNDPSLSDQANDVRLNGAVLTTIIDSILILTFFGIVYVVTLHLTGLAMFQWCALGAVALQPLLWLLKCRISKKHIKLENEQLAVIEQLYSDRVRAQLQEIN